MEFRHEYRSDRIITYTALWLDCYIVLLLYIAIIKSQIAVYQQYSNETFFEIKSIILNLIQYTRLAI